MKRYLVFYGAQYYPSEAMGDFIGDEDTIEKGVERIATEVLEHYIDNGDTVEEYVADRWEYQWASVYDTKLRKEVWNQIEEYETT